MKPQVNQPSKNLEELRARFPNCKIYEGQTGGFVVVNGFNSVVQIKEKDKEYAMPERFEKFVDKILPEEMIEDLSVNFELK